MAGRLKLITPPAAEPVTAAELKDFGRISSDVPDATLTPLIKTARQQAEKYQNRAYFNQTWEYIDDRFPRLPLSLPFPPLVSLTSVTITDITGAVTTMLTTDFVVDTSGCKGQLSLKYGKEWPSVTPERAGVAIRFVCGYGTATANTLPDDIKTAIMVGALWLYDHPGEEMASAFYCMLDPERVEPV